MLCHCPPPQNTQFAPQATAEARLARLYGHESFRAIFASWLELQPQQGDILVPATMTDAELAMLQGARARTPGTSSLATCTDYYLARLTDGLKYGHIALPA